ncbi:MAG: hypothetical protein KIT69_19635, partial [Propionibacteriaceae bacterium]|nr:hypothetical protein [Propionibacteriaceae bacterium]
GEFTAEVAIDTATGYLAVGVSVTGLTIAGIATLSGDLAFLQSSAGGVTETAIALSNVTVSITGGAQLGAGIVNGSGVLVVRATGVAGFVSGDVTLSAGSALDLSGSVTIEINTILNTAIDTSVTVGGRTLAVRFPSATAAVFELIISSGVLRIGDFLTVEGSFQTVTGGFRGTGLLVFLGQGPARLANGDLNPLAVGVLLSNATVAYLEQGTGYALLATGTVSIIGLPGVTITGDTSVRVNTTGASVNVSLPAIPGTDGEAIAINFPTSAAVTEFVVSNATLAFGGYALTGTLAFNQTGTSTTITITGGGLDLAGAVTVSSIDGTISMTAAGLLAAIDGEIAVPALGLAGLGVDVAVDTRAGAAVPLSLTLTNLDVEIAGQALHVGRLTITRQAIAGGGIATRVELTNATLAIGAGATPLLSASVASGWLLISAAGLSGSLSASVATSIPGIALGGGVQLQVNTTAAAVG